MKKLKVGILSTARINRNVIPGIRASQRCELAAVASRDAQKASAYAAEWGIPRSYGSYEALLADPELDLIYNPLPNHLHAEWTIKAAQAGKHVLCEKPLALTVADVDAISAAAASAGVQVVEAFMYRHNPLTLKARELVEDGTLGEILFMRSSFTFPLNRPGDIRLIPENGGGSLWDVGCYPVSVSRMVMGSLPVQVYGSQTLGPTGIDISFSGQLKFANHAVAQVHSSFVLPYYTVVDIRGTKGSLTIPAPFNPKQPQISFTLQVGEQTQVFTFDNPQLYRGEMDNLADVILDHVPPRLSLAESREIITILTALYQSARENRAISLL